ncbi:MAG: hypothetical protein AABX89_03530 [Candidatus Thermoplasmatota archaeon]
MPPQVQVAFDVTRPETHLVRVTLNFPAAPGKTRTFSMPAWVPGSYKIRDFGRHVQDLTATVAGKRVPVEQPTKDSWAVPAAGKAVTLTYDVYCRELTVDTSHVTSDHAHLFPATLVLYDAASRPLPHKVTLRKPKPWSQWSGLETARLDGTFAVAEDYDHLIDCPIEVGPAADYAVRRFTVAGKPHRHVVWKAPAGVDWVRVDKEMAAIAKTTIAVWGEAPYDHYTFLSHVAEGYGGGLEHRNSTVLGIDPSHLLSDEKLQTRFYPLVAHEFFHTWNVKRILPAAFQPYPLQSETYTDLLWLFEGFTSYYELPLLHRSNVVDGASWAKLVGEDLEGYHKALGRKRISVAQASRLTWTLLYQPHEHNVNRNVSYYAKGMWVGLCLDAELRRRKVKGGLDAVMRHIWRKHGKTGVGLTDDALPDLVEQATGLNLGGKIARWVDGTEELPIAAAFRTLGWTMKAEWKDPKKKLGLGLEFKPGTAQIARIWEDRPAAGVLQPDDEIVAALGTKWNPEAFAERVASRKPGDRVEIAAFREGRLRSFQVPLSESPKETFKLTPTKGSAAKRARTAWLGEGKPKPKKPARKGR